MQDEPPPIGSRRAGSEEGARDTGASCRALCATVLVSFKETFVHGEHGYSVCVCVCVWTKHISLPPAFWDVVSDPPSVAHEAALGRPDQLETAPVQIHSCVAHW